MEGLDDVVWAAETVLVAYGVRMRVRVDQAHSLAGVVEAIAPPGARVTTPGRVRRTYSLRVGNGSVARGSSRQHVGYADAKEAMRSKSLDEVTEALAGDVRRYVAEHSTGRVFIHSGVVAWKGRAILVPGRTFTGKSTLVAALVSAGATYYSDEFAVLDRHGIVHPYVKPISLRDTSHRGVNHDPASFGSVGTRPCAVGAIVITHHRAGAGYRPRSGSRGEGAMALLDNAIPARLRPLAVMSAVTQASVDAVVLMGSRGEAEAAAKYLLRRLG